MNPAVFHCKSLENSDILLNDIDNTDPDLTIPVHLLLYFMNLAAFALAFSVSEIS